MSTSSRLRIKSLEAAADMRFGKSLPIGFIGLGVMGRPMATRLVRSGWQVQVYSRRDEVAQALVAAGATRASSPAALAGQCRLVLLCVSDDEAVEQVIFGPQGLHTALARGSAIVDLSTIGSSSARRCAKRLQSSGVCYLDAPVSGGQQGAEAGTLACMIGGPAHVVEAVRDALGAFTRVVIHVGDVGSGQAVKACNQIAAASALLGVADAIALARSEGVDPALMQEVLLSGTARSFVLEKDGARLIQGNFQPGFKASLMRKDIRLALESARGRIDLQGAPVVERLLQDLCDSGDADLDWSAIGRFAQRRSVG